MPAARSTARFLILARNQSGRGRDAFRKGKRKGKDGLNLKGKGIYGQGAKKGKGKEPKGKSKGKEPQPPPFNGYCNYCWAWGHPAKECWWKPKTNAAVEADASLRGGEGV